MNTSVILLLLVVVFVTSLNLVQCNETCTERYTIIPGPTTLDGRDGVQGVPGRTGDKGDRGDIGPTGPKGDPGSTIITENDLNRVSDNVTTKINQSIIAELLDTIQTLNQTLTDRLLHLESQFVTVCNITSANWRRIAYFDTTKGDSCPTGLRTVTNAATNQTACGRNNSALGCTSLTFPSEGNYTNVCGRVRAYQHYNTNGFYPYIYQGHRTVTSPYVNGISITQNNFNSHLWTYVAARAETDYSVVYNNYDHLACPCARSTYRPLWIPTFLNGNYYCESAVVDGVQIQRRIYWEDPLWDGSGCHAQTNTCCERFGWFHRIVSPSTFNIEVRWCGYASITTTDVPTDQLEIWVM